MNIDPELNRIITLFLRLCRILFILYCGWTNSISSLLFMICIDIYMIRAFLTDYLNNKYDF